MNVHECLRWILPVGLGVVLTAAATSATAPVQASLPVPPGPYAVGTRLFHWADTDRPEIATPEPEDRREIVVQLWYPARPVAAARPAPYVPELAALEEILGPEAAAVYAAVGTNSILDAPPLPDAAPMPVVLFSHGLGQTRWSYTILAEGLASRGWLVAAVQHPGGALATVRSDGTLVPMAPFWQENSPPEVPVEEVFRRTDRRLEHWADDLGFALDRLGQSHGEAGDFQGLVDVERVGVAGHSIGGKAAVAACMRDARFDACVNLDGWPIHSHAEVNGLDQPYLYVEDLRTLTDEELEAFGATIEEYARNMRDLDDRKERIFEAMRGPAYWLVVRGIRHASFTDDPVLDPGWVPEGATMDPGAALELVGDYLDAFFATHLRDEPDPLLDPRATLRVFGAERLRHRESRD